MNINDDKLYKWGIINENDNIANPTNNITPINTTPANTKLESDKTNKKLPSIDELQKQRENIFKDI